MAWLRSWCVLAALVAALCACRTQQPTAPDRNQPPLVVALGDSLTAGPGLAPSETYPARLQERARAAGYPHVFVNAGVTGDTTADALARVDRALVPDTVVLIVALGANDGLQGVPVQDVRRNLDAIVNRGRQRSVRILLCGMETPPTHGFQYSLDFHLIYPDLARTYSLPLMPFLLIGVVGHQDLNLPDGFHPNAAGAAVIASNMWPYLEPLLR
jgi:acyl-CoA thioesterase I